ncbi:DMT family transporter [Poriferisphaera sp. WC338]|uniref:DMT family transporter n=1 Tax=Poriferisphaera sp. WC338 TaxID=3425129 RepID=UPI003D8171D2
MSSFTKGVLTMICSSIIFAIMAGLIRYADNIDATKTTLFRFAIGMAILATLAITKTIDLQCVRSPLLILRGIIGGITIFLFYLAINKVGIAKGTILIYSAPIFAAVIANIFLKEKMPRLAWFMIILAFLGMTMVIGEGRGNIWQGIGIFDALAILGALCSAVATTIIRVLRRSDTSFAIFLAQCTFGFWIVLIPATINPIDLGFISGVLLLAIGLTAAAGQILMTYAYKHVTVAQGGILGMLVPVFSSLIGLLIFQEQIAWTGWLGIAIIIVSATTLLKLREAVPVIT